MGLATGLGFAAHGLTVVGYDVKREVRDSVRRGKVPYHEPGLTELLQAQRKQCRFRILDDPGALVRDCDLVFLCVPTPSGPGGRIDLHPMLRCVGQVGRALVTARGYRVVVVKSTVVPGTTEGVVAPALYRHSGRRPSELGVAANPEFLAEGSMVKDAVRPERIVVGATDRRALRLLLRAYRPFRAPIYRLTPAGAELVKYSSNAFLALKVSFANEVSRLGDRLGANVDEVMEAVGRDPRIGPRFLRAGPGFGGSCFDKDLRAFASRARELGLRLRSAEAALRINDDQLAYVLEVLRSAVGSLKGRRIALLGLSFKAGTDDTRESRALPIAAGLVAEGAVVRGTDPAALENFRSAWRATPHSSRGRVEFCRSVPEALTNADAAVLQADWPEFLAWKASWTERMRRPLLIDLRRAVRPNVARRAGLTVVGIGAGTFLAARSGRSTP
jgi:UDPglucose 6-dehydrogenase